MPRLRVIIETDAGGDPDDEQPLVRFRLYANEWDVKRILCTRSHTKGDETKTWRRSDDSDAGVNLIIEAVDRDDDRPVWFSTNDGATSTCSALDREFKERGEVDRALRRPNDFRQRPTHGMTAEA